MVGYAFVALCNKWGIFHRAIDFCPDFCDVTVKTCCTLHNFVRQRDGFQVQDNLYECPLEVIEAIGNRGNVRGMYMGWGPQRTGMSLRWVAGMELVYRELMHRTRLWRRAPLSIGAHLGRMGEKSVHRELWEIVGWLWKRNIPLYGRSVKGTWRGGCLTEYPEGYVDKALETGISLHRGPTEESGMGLIYQGLWEMDEGSCRGGASLWESSVRGTMRGELIYWWPRKYAK